MTATIDHDRPTLGESYGIATTSSHLEMKPERRGDVDIIAAAGLLPEFLGVMLLRLSTEFDRAKSQVRVGAEMNPAEQLFVLQKLKSLRSTKDALGRYAEWRATKEAFMAPPRTVALLTGRTLVAFLNPACPHCEGRGFNGGGRHEQSGPQVLCRACRNTGLQRHSIGRGDAEATFVDGLLSHMTTQMENAANGIHRNRDTVDAAKAAIQEALRSEPR